MSSRFSRSVFPFAAVTLLGMVGMGRTASAKECMSDVDCDTGYQCNIAQTVSATGGSGSVGSSGTGTSGGTCVSPDGTNCGTVATPPVLPVDAGVAPPPTNITGICEPKPLVCASVADCPSADFDCVMDLIPVVDPTCAPGVKCPTPPPQTSGTGTCVAKARACSTATDCPAPLVCQATGSTCSGGGSVGPDGTVTTTVDTCAPGPSVCTFVPVSCTATSSCVDPLYQCLTLSETTECSGSSGSCSAGDGGLVCSPPSPPVCTTTVEMDCMPKPIDCGAGQACPAGWSCFDFANYSGGTQPVWSPNAFDKSCLPDGIILATQGHAAGAGGQVTSSSGSTSTLDGSKSADGGVAISLGDAGVGQGGSVNPPVVNPGPGNQGNQAADAGTGTPVTTQGGGCAIGGRNAGSLSSWLMLAFIGLVIRLARRRHADQ